MIVSADAVRGTILRRLVKFQFLRFLFINRSHRVVASGGFAVATCALVAIAFPLVSLWLGAALLGVPHVISGIRHTAIRREVTVVTKLSVALGLFLGLALILGAGTWSMSAMTLTFMLAMASEAWAASTKPGFRYALLSCVIGFGFLAIRYQFRFLLAVPHIHAFGSLVFWALASRQKGIYAWPIVGAAVAIGGAGAMGLLDPLMVQLGSRSWGPISIIQEVAGAYGEDQLPHAWVARMLYLYAFGQSLHYAIWLRLLPDVDRAAAVPQKLNTAFFHVEKDLGSCTLPAILACIVAAGAMLLGGPQSRQVYFSVVYFHIGLEAAATMRQFAKSLNAI